MHKVSRSLLFASVVAMGGLAACGDDIQVVQPLPTVQVSPNPVSVDVGATQAVTYTLSSGSGTAVAWTSANTAIATVDANGVVKGIAEGSTTVTAAVTVAGGTVNGTTAVNVGGDGGQASVTIQSVNTTICGAAGCNSVPAQVDNIQGQIDVTLNVEPEGRQISSVELIVFDVATGASTVCGTQNVTAGVVEAGELAVDMANAAFPITISCNTARLSAAGIPDFLNGAKQIRARLVGTNGQAVNAVVNNYSVTFANQSAFTMTVANTPTTPAALRTANGQAVSTVDGLMYRQGSLQLTFTGANYTSGAANSFETMAGALVLQSGVGPAAINFTGTKVAGTNNFTVNIPVADLATAEGVYDIQIASSTTTGGAVGPTIIINDSPTDEDVRIDNVDPVSTGAFAAALATNFYVGAAYPFAATNAALFTAPTAPADAGVGGTTVKFYAGLDAVVDAITLPELTTAEIGTLTAITTGDQLAATLTNNVYGVIAVTTDALGNHVGQRLAVNIGVDKAAPTGFAYTGTTPATGDVFDLAAGAPTIGYDPTDFEDDASGFGLNDIRVQITRLDANNLTAATRECVVGAAPAATCAAVAQPNTYTYTPTVNGYYTVTSALIDTAGNLATAVARTFLFDATAPAFTGGLTIPNLLTPGQSYSFTPAITDDIDLDIAYMVAQFGGGVSLRYAEADLGSYGEPLTQSAAPTLTIASLPRTFQVATGGVAPAAPAGAADIANIAVRAYDVAGNSTVLAQGIPAQNLAAAPAETNWAAATVGIGSFAITSPATGFDVENDATIQAGGAPETVDLVAEVLATGLDINNPFDSVEFWYQDAVTGEYIRIGAATAAVTTNAANERIFRYTLTAWNPPASLGTGVTVNVIAAGIKGVNILGTDAVGIDLVP